MLSALGSFVFETWKIKTEHFKRGYRAMSYYIKFEFESSYQLLFLFQLGNL